jgi:MFS family permease
MRREKIMVEKIKTLYYSLTFMFALAISFFFATYVLFLSKAGLNMLQINLINACFMASCFLLEVPTGAIADSLGRKFSFVLSCFVLSLSFLVYFVSGSFWMFILAEVIGGLGTTLYSGAFEAWMVDSIKFHEPDYDFKMVFTRSSQIDSLGVVIGSFLGAKVAQDNLDLPWLLSAIGMAITGIFALVVMKEMYFENAIQEKKTFTRIVNIAQESVQYGIKNRSVFYLIILGTLLAFLVMGPNMQWQILFGKQYSLKVANLGWIFVGIVAFNVFGSEISARFLGKLKNRNFSLIFSLLVVVIGLLIAGLGRELSLVMSGYFLHELARGSFQPLKQNYFNQHIPTDKRATIISFDSMIGKAGAFIGLLISGYLATIVSVQNTWIIMAMIFTIILIIFLLVFKKK